MSQKTREERGRPAREQRRLAAIHAERRRRLVRLGGIVAVAIVIAAALFIYNREQGSDLPSVRPGTIAIDAAIPRDGRVLGDPNASVTVVEWGDYQ